VGSRVPYADFNRLSASPTQNGQPGPSQGHATTSTTHSPMLNYTPTSASKRKQTDGLSVMGTIPKRRREGEEGGEGFDSDAGAQGAKHWTDEEKTKLFNWLMAPGQDEHWNALRATKNSCLREVWLFS
jgi:hypothetical protein